VAGGILAVSRVQGRAKGWTLTTTAAAAAVGERAANYPTVAALAPQLLDS
jgi:hypothetical protein